ncbi:MAG: chorismate synthase [Firmicutes bacterium]|nr:chorismate synthase [Bacillota bacterium]
MSGSIFGKVFQVATFGESHGRALGVIIDGCPSGISLDENDIQKYLNRRRPGSNKYGTKRNESDKVQILSGVFEGKTTGTPIAIAVFNEDQKSKDYSSIADIFRPGHADYTFEKKYGFRDYRGGGRSSGRETLCRVAAGAVAKKVLSEIGIDFTTYTKSIGNISIKQFNKHEIFQNPLFMPDNTAAAEASAFLDSCIKKLDSAGGTVECRVTGLPVGIGETVFDKLDANLAKAIFSIGAVKGFEIGSGFGASKLNGSENNDGFTANENGLISKTSNNSGGVLGGMSDGDTLIFSAAFKPTPSIGIVQKTVSLSGENREIAITGRHDPIVVPRAVVVVEAMAAITIVDLLLQNTYSNINNIKKIYIS